MKKYLLGIFALVLAVTFSAFTADESSNTNRWVYQLTDDSGVFDADNYSFTSAPGCEVDGDIPCTIDRGITTQVALQTYLSSKSDISDLLDDNGVEPKFAQ